ncbi:GNAT family N-acetyltransferase [Ancylobacter amanitiformis]|uniref:Ribosomal protein S18 acetylase RimI-like enzyme n=1 Tax=Ancylobacter amanitiformis TaxID=217069 RepID=A0ABU0LM12_9HYPH|nr:GNAT family N-acetyltransferase [Ancylobacter amanitiformis]MDQ0509717.1 ribosomal protein S18 acetylase RimI-like enzyme [Ancylobacter amanitiformis]
MTAPIIRPLAPDPMMIGALASMLVATVAGGGSVGFMHPLSLETAAAFCRAGLEGAARGERIILGAFVAGELAGTVTLHLALPENQPHRAEIAKMMTLPAFRGRGIASALLVEAERLARLRGRTLLVLDTASEGGAAGLYEKHGFRRAGEIPDFALKPQGGLTGTLVYFKQI